MTLPQHQQFVDRAKAFVASDSRFAGLTVGGSWGEGRLDEWSDIDLVLVAYPDHQQAILAERPAIAAGLGTVLSAFTGEHVGDPRVLICLYDEPLLHVDLKFISLPEFAVRVEDPLVLFEREAALTDILARTEGAYPHPDLQWLEDRFWVWTHYAALRLGRGELMELLDHLSYLRNIALGSLLLMKHGKSPRRVRRVELDLPPDALEQLKQTVGSYERQALIDALYASIALYRDLRAHHASPALVLRDRAEAEAMAFLDKVVTRTQEAVA